MSGIKDQFLCADCGNVLWINYHKIDDNKFLCYSCFISRKSKIEQIDLYDQFVNDILLNHAFESIRGFVEKYGVNYNHEELNKLERLLTIKYTIDFDENVLIDYIKNEYAKLIKTKDLEELEKWESEFIESNKLIKKDNEVKSENLNNNMELLCSVCNGEIDKNVFNYSKLNFGKALCIKHQGTEIQRDLFFELKKRGLFPEIEFYDGHKHVDLAVHEAKLYIELDGEHHFSDPKQLESDILRDEYSMDEGYTTKRFSNKEVTDNLSKIADCLAVVCRNRKNKISKFR